MVARKGELMRRGGSLPELLCPAGDFDALVCAVSAGADAVYVGGRHFGARAYAKNFDSDELVRAVEYCHIHGVKLYVTVNTLVYDREMRELSDYAAFLWEIGVDALICADLGAIREIKRRVPKFEIHASTQMSVHNSMGAVAAHGLGCSRVVPARELSLCDIKSIVENSPTEVEVFLHGALCVCHSGQCLMSSMVGGRSGNRGECAQPCRLPYGNSYPLSLKDLSLANHIRELIDSGVASLKIEGRMKSPDYVYRVTKIYRALLDGCRNANEEEQSELARAFSRGGFTDGYFVGKTESNMTGIRSQKDKESTKELSTVKIEPERVRMRAEVKIQLGKPSEMTLISESRSVTVYGETAVPALSSPLDRGRVCERLCKMGNTFISLDPCDVVLTLDEGVNLAPSAINALRRAAAEKMQSSSRGKAEEYTPCEIKRTKNKTKPFRTALFLDPLQLSSLLDGDKSLFAPFDAVFVPLYRLSKIDNSEIVNGVYLPPVIFDSEVCDVEGMLSYAKNRGIEYALVGNIGAIGLALRYGLIPVGDFRLNTSNSLSREVLCDLGVERIILSPELTLPMARDIGGSVIVLGRIPLMLTERCFIKENFGCDKCSRSSFVDRTGARFPLMREYPHRNLILNSTVTYMGDKRDELLSMGLASEHFIFSVESAQGIRELLSKYRKKQPMSTPVRRIGSRK